MKRAEPMLLLGSVALIAGGIAAILLGLYGAAMLLMLSAFALAIARVARRRAGPSEPLAPVHVPPEETELEEGPVWCCMKCGSIDMRQPSISEGHIPGGGPAFFSVCGRCRFRGPAIEFESATAYRQFVKGLQAEAPPEKPSG